MKTLVLYVFHQMNERVQMFLDRAFFQADDVDFLIICNNLTIQPSIPSYAKLLRRENVGFDFGAWGEGLLENNRFQNYTHFIFLNSSVVGPFLPPYCKSRWTHVFLSGLNSETHLFGSYINATGNAYGTIGRVTALAHVQSFAFAMERETLDFLLSKNIFRNYATKIQSIEEGEIGMSRCILRNGWNIGCFLACYRGVDFRFLTKKPSEYLNGFFGDVALPGQYYGQTTHPYEVVFVKANRNQDMKWLSLY